MLPPISMRRCAPLAFLTLCLALPLATCFGSRLDDIELYGAWAKAAAAGVIPYRDYPLEYPPLATLAILMPALVSCAPAGFAAAFVFAMALWDAWGKWGLAQSLPQARRPRFWLVVTVLSVLLNYVLLHRFDPVAAACTAWALGGCVRAPGALWPFVWLGLGVAVKLYPVILAPAMLVFVWHQHHKIVLCAAQAAAMATAAAAPSLVAYSWLGSNSLSWLRYHQERGLHVASSLLSWAIVMQGGPGVALPPEFAYGCTQIVGARYTQLAHLSFALTLGGLGATYAAMLPSLKTSAGLWRTATALVCALLLSAKVFSPQYMIWLIGIGAAACAQPGRLSPVVLISLITAVLATAQLYPGEARIFLGWRSAQMWLIVRTASLLLLWAHLARPWRHWRPQNTTRCAIDKRLGHCNFIFGDW